MKGDTCVLLGVIGLIIRERCGMFYWRDLLCCRPPPPWSTVRRPSSWPSTACPRPSTTSSCGTGCTCCARTWGARSSRCTRPMPSSTWGTHTRPSGERQASLSCMRGKVRSAVSLLPFLEFFFFRYAWFFFFFWGGGGCWTMRDAHSAIRWVAGLPFLHPRKS